MRRTKRNAEKIIQDSKSRKNRKMQGIHRNQNSTLQGMQLWERLLKQEKTGTDGKNRC